jgi:hypothetical protein
MRTYPPFSQTIHGSLGLSPGAAVSDPASFSNAMKNSVSLGWLARLTDTLPAKVLFGKEGA